MTVLPRHATIGDVMTARVHTATAMTPFKVLVRIIEENHIGGIPVVDENGAVLGVVSESDLMQKERRRQLESSEDLIHLGRRRRERAVAHGTVASDVMSAPAVTITPDAPLAEAAKLMQHKNVHRLVVVDATGRLVGIVSRSDLLRVYLRSDDDLHRQITGEVIRAILLPGSEVPDVDVELGIVTLSGEVDRRSDVGILIRLVQELDGVVAVQDRLRYRWDDSNVTATPPASEREASPTLW